MTPKSIQQRAMGHANKIEGDQKFETADSAWLAAYVGYTAGATDERRELGKIILEIAEALSKLSKQKLGVEYNLAESGHIVAAQLLEKNAELIATLREELE